MSCFPTQKPKYLKKIRRTFAAHFANIRRTRAALFTKFAAHLPHIKQFKELVRHRTICEILPHFIFAFDIINNTLTNFNLFMNMTFILDKLVSRALSRSYNVKYGNFTNFIFTSTSKIKVLPVRLDFDGVEPKHLQGSFLAYASITALASATGEKDTPGRRGRSPPTP